MNLKTIDDLVKCAQAGDADAFGELYSIYANDMYRFACYYTGSLSYAEDAVSEAVLNGFQKITQLNNPTAFKAWLFSILFNCCKKAQREKALSKSRVELSLANEIKDEKSSFFESFELKSALALLNEEEREIVLLSFACGYTSEEIGEILELNSSTVRSKISRSVAKMRKVIIG